MKEDPTARVPAFEAKVKEAFTFLEGCGTRFAGIRQVNPGYERDTGLVARYRGSDFRVDIGWSETERSLTVLVKLDRNDLPRHARYVYLEPFIEYATAGKEQSVIAQIYPRMRESRILKAMRWRQQAIDGQELAALLNKLAEKLRVYLPQILRAPADVIMAYHAWAKSGAHGISRG